MCVSASERPFVVSVLICGRVSAGVCLKLTPKGVNIAGKIYPIEIKLLIIESARADPRRP
jgi:hypothetical protein